MEEIKSIKSSLHSSSYKTENNEKTIKNINTKLDLYLKDKEIDKRVESRNDARSFPPSFQLWPRT